MVCKIKCNNNFIKIEKFISDLLNNSIPYRRYKEKIKDDDIIIPDFKDYNNILDINYNLTQLKKIAKAYGIKTTGNKDELKKRCYNLLYYGYHAIYIQKIFRKNFIKVYFYLHGPAFLKRQLCTNDVDFCTLDEVEKINKHQFFSFKDDDNFIYGFDIQSIYNLYAKNSSKVENPFNKKIINKEVFDKLIYLMKYSKILNINLKINYEKPNYVNESKELEIKILNLFQTMDSLGNYTNANWFNVLNKSELIRFLKELLDIWNYRASLTPETKREICPPHGNPFRALNINYNNISSYNFNVIKKNIVNVIDELINKGLTDDLKSLGTYYVLSALTLVNNDAAEALPWLYESVHYTNNNNQINPNGGGNNSITPF